MSKLFIVYNLYITGIFIIISVGQDKCFCGMLRPQLSSNDYKHSRVTLGVDNENFDIGTLLKVLSFHLLSSSLAESRKMSTLESMILSTEQIIGRLYSVFWMDSYCLPLVRIR